MANVGKPYTKYTCAVCDKVEEAHMQGQVPVRPRGWGTVQIEHFGSKTTTYTCCPKHLSKVFSSLS